MPNPTKKYFRRPAVRRCRKVSSKTFKKVSPDRGYYDTAPSRVRGGLSDWLAKEQEYTGMHHGRSKGRQQCLPQGGYLCGSRPQIAPPQYDPSSMSNLSECMTDDSRYSARGGGHSAAMQSAPCKPVPERLPAGGGAGGNETSAHRELMFMIDQLEQAELEKIQRDLRQFQTSRRRLMFNLSSLSATSSPPARLMQPVAGSAAVSSGCPPIMPAP
ncbi:uncharacterized protein LOC123680328 [Harmonia axyridis]|uniref:uncharacterized protein LOC123680328 n=1 Tax=Harmonia axyridis TaxID=115357 RepID=UPI001E277FC2|nr:uncharacterized protein LOC123680328 [Harmonia axyridis]